MNKLESLAFTRISACFLASSMAIGDIGSAIVAQAELEDMLDELYSGHKELISPEEYEVAKKSPDAFIAIIDRIHRHYVTMERKAEESS